MVIFLGQTSWISLRTCLIVSLRWLCFVVPDVTDMPVSPSSVVTEFCDGFSCCSEWEFV